MTASEALSQIEQDQAKALERFFKEWDEICLDTKKWSIQLSRIDTSAIRLVGLSMGHQYKFCPITAVYFQRYHNYHVMSEAELLGPSLNLSLKDSREITIASDLYQGHSIDMRGRLVKGLYSRVELHKRRLGT